MSRYMQIVARELVGRTQLAGASMGEADLPVFKHALAQATSDGVILISWAGVISATASYLRSGFVPSILQAKNVVVCVDLPSLVREDLEIALEAAKVAVLCAEKQKSEKSLRLSVIGELDSSYRETLSLVQAHGPVTATELSSSDTGIGKTAWMTRLGRLYDMKLILRSKTGKEYKYFNPDLKGL